MATTSNIAGSNRKPQIDEAGIDVLVQKAKETCLVFASRAAEEAARMAPQETGRLSESVKAWKTDAGAAFGSDVEYAAYVELGTRHQVAEPFLRPAISAVAGIS